MQRAELVQGALKIQPFQSPLDRALLLEGLSRARNETLQAPWAGRAHVAQAHQDLVKEEAAEGQAAR